MKRKVLAQLLCIVILLQPFLEALPVSAAEPHYTAVAINGSGATPVTAPDGQPAYKFAVGDGPRIASGVGDQSGYHEKYFVFDVWTGGANMPVSGDLAILPISGSGPWWGGGARFAAISKASADSSDWMTFFVELSDSNIRKEGSNNDGLDGSEVLKINELGFSINANGFAGEFIIRNARFQDNPHSPRPVPSISEDNGESITLTATATGNSQAVEYAVNTTGAAPGVWQQSATFTKPVADTYYIFARAAENDEFIAGTYSRITITSIDDQSLVDQAAADLNWDFIKNANTDQNNVKTRLNLPSTIGATGVSVAWNSSSAAIGSDGNVDRLYDRENNKEITLTATISKGDAVPATKGIIVTVLAVPEAINALPVSNLSNVTSDVLDGQQVSRINRAWTQNENVLHIIDAPPRADLLDYANLYFAFDMFVTDASLLNLGTNVWFVIDAGQGDWNSNSRLHIDRSAFAGAQSNTWITVGAHLSGGNTQNGFSPSSLDNVRRMGLHLDFAAVPTGSMYIKNVRFQPDEPSVVTPPDPEEPGQATAFFDFNDYGPYTANEAPSAPPEGKVEGEGISVGGYGDEQNPNLMVQRGAQSEWGMSKGNFIYVTVTDQDLKNASRVKVIIEYWRTGNNSNINLQYVSVGNNFQVATAVRSTGDNNNWAFAEVTLNNTNFNVGHNQGAQFRISSPDGITIKSIRITEMSMTDAESVANASNLLTWDAIRGDNTTQTLVETALNLNQTGANGTEIEWESSNNDVINSETGEVIRQIDNTSVTLTATISKGTATPSVKTFNIVVRGKGTGTDEDAVNAMLNKLTWDLIKGVNASEGNVTTNLVLPSMGDNMTDITWATSNAAIITTAGVIPTNRPDGGGTVTLTATVTRGPVGNPVTGTKTFELTVPDRYDYAKHIRTAIAQVNDAKDWAISDFNVLAFGAKTVEMEEGFDNREAFQAAIDAAYNDGGGVVYIPAGTYAFYTETTGTTSVLSTTGNTTYEFKKVLSLRAGVQLRGEWDNPDATGYDGTIDGTILAVYAGHNSANYDTYVDSDERENQTGGKKVANVSDRFIDMEQGTGVSNLAVWYPNQDISVDTVVEVRGEDGQKTGQTETIKGIPYPWTFFQRTGNSATLDNVTLVNAWGGFISLPSEMHYVVNSNMTALYKGIVVHTCTDIGRIENVSIDPKYWANSGLPGAPTLAAVRAYTRANATGFMMHRSDWEYVAGLHVSGYKVGMWIGREPGGDEAPNAQFYGLKIEDSVTGIYIDNVNGFGLLFSNSEFGGDTAVEFDERFNTSVQFNGVAFKGPIVSKARGGVISFEDSTFDVESGQFALDFLNRGNALVSQSNFKQADKHVRLGANFGTFKSVNSGYNLNIDSTDLAAHLANLELDVTGGNSATVQIVNDVEYVFVPIPKDVKTDIDVHPRPTSNAVLRIDFPRSLTSSAPTVDISAKLQEALNYIKEYHDGGTVYLPGGRYRLDSPVIVPEGVELRGTWDVQHHTQGGGTAIFTTYTGGVQGEAGASLIQLKANAGLRGLTITQANLTSVNLDVPDSTLKTPFLVQGQGAGVYAINLTIPIGDKGIDLASYKTDGHYVDYLGGTLLRAGIWVGGGAEGGFIRNMQFNPHYALRLPGGQGYTAPTPSNDVYAFVQRYSSALKFSDVEDQTIFNNFVFGSVYGIHFLKRDLGNGEFAYPGKMTMIGHGSDGTTYALYVEDADEHTKIIAINSELVNTNIPTEPQRAYVRMGDVASTAKIHPDAELVLYNSAFWGSPTVAGAIVNNGIVRFQQANFTQLPGSKPGIDVQGGQAHVYSSYFQPSKNGSDENVYAMLRSTGESIELSNNYYASGLRNSAPVSNPYGIYGSDLLAEPFVFSLTQSGAGQQFNFKFNVGGRSSAPGTVTIVSPSAYAEEFTPIPFNALAAGESVTVDLPHYVAGLITFKLQLEDGKAYTYTAKFDEAYAEKVSTAGGENPAKNAATPAYVMDTMDYVTAGTWGSPQDLSAESHFAWDDNNLYAYIVVTDDVHYSVQTGGNIWMEDNLQLGIDLINPATDSTMRNELGFTLNNSGDVIVHAWTRPTGVNAPTAEITAIEAAITRDEAAKSTIYDLKIPFNTVHSNPASVLGNGRIGISIMLNESDGSNESAGTRGTFEVEAGHLKNSTLFTDLYLLNAGGYNVKLEASAIAAVEKALVFDSAANIATARNFIALLPDGVVKTGLQNEIAEIAEPYIVTFKDWDGTVLKTEEVIHGANATAPTPPSRIGYTFTGWSVAFTNVRSNLTVVAQYEAAPTNPSNPGSIWIPPTTVINVDSGGNVTVNSTPTMNYSSNIAQSSLSQSDIDNAFNRAAEGANRIKVQVSSVQNAVGYGVEIPTSFFKEDINRSVAIETPFGTVLVSNAMLNADQLNGAGNTVTFVVRQADKSGWSEQLIDEVGDHPVLDLSVMSGGKQIAWNNSEAPVTITIPYTPTASEQQNTDQLVVWFVDGEGNITPVPSGRYDSETGHMVFQTSHFSQYAIVYAAPKFSDLSSVAWAAKEIEALAARGVVEGTSATTFDPGTAISRGEFLAHLIRLLELDTEFTDNFTDVSASSPYYKELGIGRALGIVEGVGGNKYLPDTEISREDVAVIIKRALDQWQNKLPEVSSKSIDDFKDGAKTAAYAREGLAYLLSVGLLQGNGDNTLNPKGNLTRAEAAVILYRIYTQSH